MIAPLRSLVPRPLRTAVRLRLAERRREAILRALSVLAAGREPIVVGPWLGEVGFELLYWLPFLRWFAAEFSVARERLTVISRGGTAAWYAPFAAGYEDVLDVVSPDAFRDAHDARVRELGEQKQTRVTAFERGLLDALAARRGAPGRLLHPSTMYALFTPFWWQHADESWVHRHARYERLSGDAAAPVAALPSSYVAVKFYFNDCFPKTDANIAFARETIAARARESAVVSLTTGLRLDDHGSLDRGGPGVIDLPAVAPGRNLAMQSAIVSRAAAFVGTYGGFSYLAPFHGVRSIAYHADAGGFSARHLLMARSALSTLGDGDLLDVRPVTSGAPLH